MADISKIKIPSNTSAYDIKDTTARNNAAMNLSSIGIKSKNLLKPVWHEQEINKVTLVKNDDGTVTINGTATGGDVSFYCSGLSDNLTAGNYICSGCPSGGNAERGYSMYFGDGLWDIGKGVKAINKIPTYGRIIIREGCTVEHLTFYPMIRYADITDGTYEPYQDDLQTQINNNNNDIALNLSSIGMSKKNLLKNTSGSQSEYGVDFTVNSDGSITASRKESNSNHAYYIIRKTKLPKGTYIFTGDNNALQSGPHLGIYKYSSNGTYLGYQLPNVPFTVNDETVSYQFTIIYQSSYSESVTFYPMLRYADITDGTYEPYTDDLQTQIQNNNQKIEYITGISRKNLCNITYTSRKVNNVLNVTVNSDKTISLLTDSAVTVNVIEILTPLITLKANTTYILSGGISSIIRLELRDENKNPFIFDSGSGTEYTSRTNKNVYVAVRIQSGTEINPSVTLSPMLRIKGTDSTYEPYQDDLQTQINNILARLTAGGI